ncbi:MAG: hypothetical protein IJR82_05810 [Bacilli bacterium]|nr:hypothetical protein [Bacilli bacterium]
MIDRLEGYTGNGFNERRSYISLHNGLNYIKDEEDEKNNKENNEKEKERIAHIIEQRRNDLLMHTHLVNHDLMVNNLNKNINSDLNNLDSYQMHQLENISMLQNHGLNTKLDILNQQKRLNDNNK